MAADWIIWQLLDSAFPAGSFAHSAGLEAAWQTGLLGDSSNLAEFIRSGLRQTARSTAVFAAATCRDPAGFASADLLCDATLVNHIANRASRLQGQALLTAAERIFGDCQITDFAAAARTQQAMLHYGPVFGVIAALLRINDRQACSTLLFMSLRTFVSAAVRLGIVGPLEAQAVQARVGAEAETMVDLAMRLGPDDFVQTLPILELAQGAQERLYSRLFQS